MRFVAWLACLGALCGCNPVDDACIDEDGDGYGVGESCEDEDCDDTDPEITSCGGEDTGDVELDDDQDGWDRPEDCDDDDPDIYPGAPEACDGVDQDCDGTIDNDATDAQTWYADSDSDTYGDDGSTLVACSAPAGHVAAAGDCSDTDPAVNPAASELCNDVDDDCDLEVDEDPTDPTTWYADTDADTYGDDTSTQLACDAPANHVASGGDCDDTAAAVNPDETEVCNGIDDDCSGFVDDGATDAPDIFVDGDADAFGAGAAVRQDCAGPSAGEALVDGDCDDADPTVNPGAFDYPGDGADADCDGVDLPVGDSPNDFYVSDLLGDDTPGPGRGTMATPYQTIGAAITASSPGDWIHIDQGTYGDIISAPRHYVGSYDAASAWALDLTARSTTVSTGTNAVLATFSAGEPFTLAGMTLVAGGSFAVDVTSADGGTFTMVDSQVTGRIDTDGVNLAMRDVDLTGDQFALRVNGTAGTRTEVLGGTYAGTIAGAWFGGSATVEGASFSGQAGFLARPDFGGGATLVLNNVVAQGEYRGGTIDAFTAEIWDSTITHDALPGGPSNIARGLQIGQNADVLVVRSRIASGWPGLSASPYSFFDGIYVDNSQLTLIGSDVQAISGLEGTTQARAVRGVGSADLTVINSSLYADAQGGILAEGVASWDGGPVTVVNTAIHVNGGGFLNNRGNTIDVSTPATFHHVYVDQSADSFVQVLGDTAYDAAGAEACTWGACQAATVLTIGDAQFNDVFGGDLTPAGGSPLIGGGVDPLAIDASWSDLPIDFDIDGNARPNGLWDIGAYEQ